MTTSILYLVPPGKRRCYITEKLRPDTPEENVRQRWARSLVEEYGYPRADIGVEVLVRMGRARKYADLVVYKHDAPRTQENVDVIVEAKRDDKLPSDSASGDGQLKSYMAACSSCRFGLWVGKEMRAYEKQENGEIERIPRIPRFGADAPTRPTRGDLVPSHELKSVFKRCHDYIWANAGIQKADAFHELLKLIFCKTFDEEESQELLFGVDPQERAGIAGQRSLVEDRLEPLFRAVREKYPFIFDDDDRLKLEPRVVAYIVAELQYLSLLDTDTDVKGDAYEELVGSNLRGDRGQYFTPRNVCDMAVQMAMSLYPAASLTRLKVLDCCCGTGGFLVSWLTNLREILLAQEEERPHSKTAPEEKARQRVFEVCQRNLFGVDIDPALVRTCQMNLVLHGDGSTNIYRADSVRSPGEWDTEARGQIPHGKVDVLFTNPPFGGKAKIDDGHILGQYELPGWEVDSPRGSMPAEQLFVEAALRFLKGGGYLVIVVPNGIVNNPGLAFIRSWLLRRTRIVASVGLPKTTFAASNGINNPTVLIAQKFTRAEAQQADKNVLGSTYDLFLSTPRTAGITARGKPIYMRHPDGQEIVDDTGQKIRDDEIQGVADKFRRWKEQGASGI